MKISTLFYTIRQGFVNIFRNKWYSLASVATIAACLFLFGLFYSVVMNFRSIVMKAEEGVSVTVFFHNEKDMCDSHGEGQIPSDARIEEIGQLIAGRAEVSDVVFTSDEEAWENYRRENWGENYEAYSKGFLENPLEGDDSYEIFISDVSMQSALVTWLESLPEVRKVNHSALTADTLSGANLLIAYVSIGIIVILLAVAIFLISNTVAMGITVRKEEIAIMKYIGAKDFVVRSPFVIEGLIIGLVGAVLPLALLYVLYGRAVAYVMEKFSLLMNIIDFLPVVSVYRYLLPIGLGLGVGIGFLGSYFTVRKHLKV